MCSSDLHRGYHVAKGGSQVQAISLVALDGGAVVRIDSTVHELAALDAMFGGDPTTVEVVRGAVVVVS